MKLYIGNTKNPRELRCIRCNANNWGIILLEENNIPIRYRCTTQRCMYILEHSDYENGLRK